MVETKKKSLKSRIELISPQSTRSSSNFFSMLNLQQNTWTSVTFSAPIDRGLIFNLQIAAKHISGNVAWVMATTSASAADNLDAFPALIIS